MKKDGKINYKLLAKMMPAQFRHIGQEMLDECRNISKYQHLDIETKTLMLICKLHCIVELEKLLYIIIVYNIVYTILYT